MKTRSVQARLVYGFDGSFRLYKLYITTRRTSFLSDGGGGGGCGVGNEWNLKGGAKREWGNACNKDQKLIVLISPLGSCIIYSYLIHIQMSILMLPVITFILGFLVNICQHPSSPSDDPTNHTTLLTVTPINYI